MNISLQSSNQDNNKSDLFLNKKGRTRVTKKQPHLHPLIMKLAQIDLQLKEFLDKRGNETRNEISYSANQKKQLVLFKKQVLCRILLVYSTRLSFHDHKAVPILYDITFFGRSDLSTPQVTLYRKEKGKLRIVHIAKMNLIEKTENYLHLNCLDGTLAELSLKIFLFYTHTAFQIEDRFQHILFAATSAEEVDDLIVCLRTLLKFLCFPTLSKYLRSLVSSQTQSLIEHIIQSKPLREKAIQVLSVDPIALFSLLHYRIYTFERHDSPVSRIFIEEIISKKEILDIPYQTKIKKCQNLDSSTMVFHVWQTNNDKEELSLRFIKHILPHTRQEREEVYHILQHLQALKKVYPEARKNTIELICYKSHATNNLNHYFYQTFLQSIDLDPSLDLKQITFLVKDHDKLDYYTFNTHRHSFIEDRRLRHIYPPHVDFLEFYQLNHFDLKQDFNHSNNFSYLYYADAHHHTKEGHDHRLVGISLVFCPELHGHALGYQLEELNLQDSLEHLIDSMQASLQKRNPKNRPVWNCMFFQILPILNMAETELSSLIDEMLGDYYDKYYEKFKELHLEKLILKIRIKNSHSLKGFDTFLVELKNLLKIQPLVSIKRLQADQFFNLVSSKTWIEVREEQARAKGAIWAYRIPELINYASEKFRRIELKQKPYSQEIRENFIELDLDPSQIVIDPKTGCIDFNNGELIPALDENGQPRSAGLNQAGVVIGIKIDDLNLGIPVKRLLIIGDITHTTRGTISAQECARINAAIRYATREIIPIDWFSASYGVEIKRDKGVESLEASASTTREIIRHCHHAGLQINLIVDETNIGAQSYWNALAAIMPGTCGLLIMTPHGSMALTGPNALVCALHNVHSQDIPTYAKGLYPDGLQSLSGYTLVHGPNSDAMIMTKDLQTACELLIRHHYYSYLGANERMVSRRIIDELNQDQNPPTPEIHLNLDKEINKLLKGFKPNRDIILEALRDRGSPQPIRLWNDAKGIRGQSLRKGDFPQEATIIIQEMLIDGLPTMVIFSPVGPITPADADIIARAIHKANARMPVMIIGSLTGFSCDPLSMENRQLLAGASIAKAIVEHQGPILVVNLGNLVGGTFVVLSKQLNRHLIILAIEGSRIQVIGGNAAAKVIFHSSICKQAEEDPRVLKIRNLLSKFSNKEKKGEIEEDITNKKIRSISHNKLRELENSLEFTRRNVIEEIEIREGASFDQIHSVERALKVGSIDAIIPLRTLRQSIIQYQQRGLIQYLKSLKTSKHDSH